MSKPAIQIDGLGKRYRIGRRQAPASSGWGRSFLSLLSPFQYMRTMLRPPQEDEIFWALRDLSCEIQPGEVWGLIGPNGAGKSTLLKLLSRITAPSEGRAVLRGRVASLLEVGTGFHPDLTGRENIYLAGVILGLTRSEISARFDEIVAFSELETFLDTPVKRYSSGMYVRLAFSVAAHLEPEILLVDEVLAVGDYGFQQKCMGKMSDTMQAGSTIIFVSHNMAVMKRICQKGIYLNHGRSMYTGDIDTAVQAYLASSVESSAACAPIEIREDAFARYAGSCRLVGFEVLSETQERVSSIASGMPVCFRIHYEFDQDFRNPGFAFVLTTELGEKVLHLSTQPVSGYDIPPQPMGRGAIDLRIDALPLAAGNYQVNLKLTRANMDTVHEYANVALIRVQGADVYGSGFHPHADIGVVVCAHQWALLNVRDRLAKG